MAESHAYRKRFFWGNLAFLALCVVILVMVYALSDLLSGSKIDLTADKVYTVSPATKEILQGLKDKVQANYYVSNAEKLPSFLQSLARDTRDLFEEFQEISGGKFQFTILNPEEKAAKEAEAKVADYEAARAKNEKPQEPEPVQSIEQIFGGKKGPTADDIRAQRDKDAQAIATRQGRKKEDVYRELLQKDFERNILDKMEQEGIQAYPFMEREAGSVKQVKVYTAIEVRYLDKQPEIIPIHYSIEALEYELASRILKLTQDEKPVVAFFDARKPPAPEFNPMRPMQPPASDFDGVVNFLGQLFDIRTFDLKEKDGLDDLVRRLKEDEERRAREKAGEDEPKDKKEDVPVTDEDIGKHLKCLVIAQPDALEPRQVYEINRAASLGVPTIVLASRFSMDISDNGLRSGLPLNMMTPGAEFEDMLRKWGIELGSEILASNECGTVQVPQSLGGLRVLMPAPVPINVESKGSDINQLSALTNRIPQLIFPATTGIKLLADALKKSNLTSEVLAKTPQHTWGTKLDPFARLNNPMLKHKGLGTSVMENREALMGMKNPEEYQDFLPEPATLVALVTGKLPFHFEGETIPEWKKEPKPEEPGEGGLEDVHRGVFGGPKRGGDKALLVNADDPQDTPAPAPPAPSPQPPAGEPAPATPNLQPAPPPAPTTPLPPAPGTPPPGAAPAIPAPAPGSGESKPEAKTETPPPAKAHVEPKNGRVLVVASADMLKTDFLQQGNEYRANVSFFQNAMETFGLDERLLQIRRKQLTVRQFKPGSDRWYKPITVVNIFVVPLVIGLAGLAYFLLRRTESNTYEKRYISG